MQWQGTATSQYTLPRFCGSVTWSMWPQVPLTLGGQACRIDSESGKAFLAICQVQLARPADGSAMLLNIPIDAHLLSPAELLFQCQFHLNLPACICNTVPDDTQVLECLEAYADAAFSHHITHACQCVLLILGRINLFGTLVKEYGPLLPLCSTKMKACLICILGGSEDVHNSDQLNECYVMPKGHDICTPVPKLPVSPQVLLSTSSQTLTQGTYEPATPTSTPCKVTLVPQVPPYTGAATSSAPALMYN